MLYDHRGDLILHKKAAPPKLGPAFGDWAGRDVIWNQMPGGAILQFDLSRLTLADYRSMRHHSQVNASLSGLTFMMHQIEWHIECTDKKIATQIEENLREIWTRLIRAISQSFWAGYSPNALEFENGHNDGINIRVSKIKDLYPEDCRPHWKSVFGSLPPGSAPGGIRPKFKVYDGIEQYGSPGPIPVENTLWYPLLMENGDYLGRKLLKACFTPWYFSTLVHLFANRYYERFGEPTPIGRAPYDEEITQQDGTVANGKDVMDMILMNLRNRGVVNLPSDRDPVTKEFDYTLEYLESQMRGADFERYLNRLDEEISLGLFTPLLLMKTGDNGSNNLGVQHTQTWLWMLNAIAGDLAEYITVLCERLKAINFSPQSAPVKWVFNKLGKENPDTIRAIMVELVRSDKVKVDLDQLGEALGMNIQEIKQVTQPPGALPPNHPANPLNPNNTLGPNGQPATLPPTAPGAPRTDIRNRPGRVRGRSAPRGVNEPRATGRSINNRIKGQVEAAFKNHTFGSKTFKPDLGFRRRFQTSLEAEGLEPGEALIETNEFYTKAQTWLDHAISLGMDEYTSATDFMAIFERKIDSMIEALVDEP